MQKILLLSAALYIMSCVGEEQSLARDNFEPLLSPYSDQCKNPNDPKLLTPDDIKFDQITLPANCGDRNFDPLSMDNQSKAILRFASYPIIKKAAKDDDPFMQSLAGIVFTFFENFKKARYYFQLAAKTNDEMSIQALEIFEHFPHSTNLKSLMNMLIETKPINLLHQLISEQLIDNIEIDQSFYQKYKKLPQAMFIASVLEYNYKASTHFKSLDLGIYNNHYLIQIFDTCLYFDTCSLEPDNKKLDQMIRSLLDQGHEEALYLLAVCYLEQEVLEEHITEIEKLLKEDVSDPVMHAIYGCYLIADKNNLKKGLFWLEKAWTQYPKILEWLHLNTPEVQELYQLEKGPLLSNRVKAAFFFYQLLCSHVLCPPDYNHKLIEELEKYSIDQNISIPIKLYAAMNRSLLLETYLNDSYSVYNANEICTLFEYIIEHDLPSSELNNIEDQSSINQLMNEIFQFAYIKLTENEFNKRGPYHNFEKAYTYATRALEINAIPTMNKLAHYSIAELKSGLRGVAPNINEAATHAQKFFELDIPTNFTCSFFRDGNIVFDNLPLFPLAKAYQYGTNEVTTDPYKAAKLYTEFLKEATDTKFKYEAQIEKATLIMQGIIEHTHDTEVEELCLYVLSKPCEQHIHERAQKLLHLVKQKQLGMIF